MCDKVNKYMDQLELLYTEAIYLNVDPQCLSNCNFNRKKKERK